MNAELKWYEVIGGLLIGIVVIGYLALKDQADQTPGNASIAQISAPAETISVPNAPTDPYGVDQTDHKNYGQVMQLALRGNYQAQRNIAYGFAAQPYQGQQKNPVLACAWYLVVLNSGSSHLDLSDSGNVETYCGKLDADLLDTAKMHASRFSGEIAENTRFGNLD